MARSVRRKSTPLSPAKSRAQAASPRQTRNSKRTLTREPEPRQTRQKIQVQLEPVNEDEDTITVNTNGRAAEPVTATNNVPNDTFDSAESSEAGSDSDDMSELDRDDILESLDDVERYSHKVLEVFNSGPVFDTIHILNDPSSKKARKFQKILTRLSSDLEPCGRGFMMFCPIFQILNVFSDRSSGGLEAVFCKANAAILVSKLAEINDNDRAVRSELLQALNTANHFPNFFFSFNDEADLVDERFCAQTADVAISLLVQYFIDMVGNTKNGQEIDTADLLNKIFLDEELQPKNLSCGIRSAETQHAIHEMILQAVGEIKKLIQGRSRSKRNLSALRAKYPWASMVEELVEWIRNAHVRLNERIAAWGGVQKMIEDLEQTSVMEIQDSVQEEGDELSSSHRDKLAFRDEVTYLQKVDEELDAHLQNGDESELEEEVDIAHAGSLSRTRTVDKQLARNVTTIRDPATMTSRQREKAAVIRQPSQQTDGPPRSLTPQVDLEEESAVAQASNTHQGLDKDQDALEPEEPRQVREVRATQETLGVMNAIGLHESSSDKENHPTKQRYRLYEQQPDAVRVVFDDESQPAPSRSNKRTQQQMSEDDDYDAFETDARQRKHIRRNNGKGITGAPSEARGSGMFVGDSEEPEEQEEPHRPVQRQPLGEIRARSTQAEASTAGNRDRQTATTYRNATNSPERDRGSVTASRQPPHSSAADAYADIRQDAARNVQRAALVTAAQHPMRMPQVRRPWDKTEIEALLFWLEKFGPAWAKIKEADSESRRPRLADRNQVQLKDKARNMKLDFLKAEMPLPNYLETVTISQRHKEDLRNRGIAIPGDHE